MICKLKRLSKRRCVLYSCGAAVIYTWFNLLYTQSMFNLYSNGNPGKTEELVDSERAAKIAHYRQLLIDKQDGKRFSSVDHVGQNIGRAVNLKSSQYVHSRFIYNSIFMINNSGTIMHMNTDEMVQKQLELVESYTNTDSSSYLPLTRRNVKNNKNVVSAHSLTYLPSSIGKPLNKNTIVTEGRHFNSLKLFPPTCPQSHKHTLVLDSGNHTIGYRDQYSVTYLNQQEVLYCQSSNKSSIQLKDIYPNIKKPNSGRDSTVFKLLRWDPPQESSRTLGNDWFGSVDGKSTFEQCDYSNCEITTNRSDVATSHAVLVHMWLTQFNFSKTLPRKRPEGQKWIMFLGEAPKMSTYAKALRIYRGRYTKMSNIFNATWAYHRKADIWTDYGSYYLKKRQTPLTNLRGINYAAGKTRVAAWFSTNCVAVTSKRVEYVMDLQRYIKIDIYGQCGTFICPRDNEEACIKTLHRKYKFYLAFENALCEDYLTEKLWKIVPHVNVIPVVLGAGNYSEVLPLGSYIDIGDFNSTKELAKFMHRIDKDDVLFNSFFEYRKFYEIRFFESAFCQVCRYMNENHHVRKIYDRMANFWDQKKDCTTPEIFYKNVHRSMWKIDMCKNGTYELTEGIQQVCRKRKSEAENAKKKRLSRNHNKKVPHLHSRNIRTFLIYKPFVLLVTLLIVLTTALLLTAVCRFIFTR